MPHTAVNEKALEQLLSKELQALDARKGSDEDADFRKALEQLMEDYGLSARDVADILRSKQRTERAREAKLKVFRNPYTKETVRTYGYNHATLNEWRRRHGRIMVQSWRIR
ncbi:H-NS family nucleoid-associated regulatory protein [Marinobacteraceae bacterium S3BR75-40.1]